MERYDIRALLHLLETILQPDIYHTGMPNGQCGSQCMQMRRRSLIGSRPSDHYFRSVCWFVCLFVCAEFFSAVFDPISIKLGHMLHVWVLCPLEYRGCATPGGWVTPKTCILGVLGLADCTTGRESHSVAASN